MSASMYVGRVGGLAVVFGVGSALLTGVGVAAADTGGATSPDTSSSSTADSSSTNTSASATTGRASRAGARAARASSVQAPSAAAVAVPDTGQVRQSTPSGKENRSTVVRRDRSSTRAVTVPSVVDSSAPEANSAAATTVAQRPLAAALASLSSLPTTLSSGTVLPSVLPALTAQLSHTAPLPTLASLFAPRLGTVAPPTMVPAPAASVVGTINPVTDPTKATTPTKDLLSLVFTAIVEMAVVSVYSVANFAPPSPMSPTPSLSLNGFDLVPNGPENITSFYGRWTYLPGAPGLMQGKQQFDVVDPTTSETVGSFGALVSRGNGYNYETLLVTSNDGTNVGIGAGQTPPVGSLISSLKIGKFGWSYTSMPSDSGDVVSFKVLTPFGEFAVPMSFNAAKGYADQTADNRPIVLTNGYSIAPADPRGEHLTATSGILPLFTTIQGDQKFNVYDENGNAVGSFNGQFTTTADIVGTYTQAVIVTGNDGTNVGTAPGQVPPVGTVYNVIYTGSDDDFTLYTSMPAPSGDVISLVQHKPDGTVTNVTPTFINASAYPTKTLTTPSGLKFVPTSAVRTTGVNGLPPREVQIQGYQQFDVVNKAGKKVGSFDADVSTQWDLWGIQSHAIMVTNVTSGTAGTGAGDVPPVGTVYNFVSLGNTGLGIYHAVVPSADGDVVTASFRTPVADIPMYSVTKPSGNRGGVTFYDPFVLV